LVAEAFPRLHDLPFNVGVGSTKMDFVTALHEAEKWVGEVDGVESVAEGVHDGHPCITVFVSSETPARILPRQLGAWPVVVELSELLRR
jgi:hypothetical protein